MLIDGQSRVVIEDIDRHSTVQVFSMRDPNFPLAENDTNLFMDKNYYSGFRRKARVRKCNRFVAKGGSWSQAFHA